MTLREHLNEIAAELQRLGHDVQWDDRHDSSADGHCRNCGGAITVKEDTFGHLERHSGLFAFSCIPNIQDAQQS